jgi:hypothetical protein
VLARAHPLPGVVVGGAIVGVHAVLPGRLGIHSRGNAAEQAFHRLTDPHATAIRAVGQGLELVDVHAGGAADAAEQAGEGDGLLPVTVPRCERARRLEPSPVRYRHPGARRTPPVEWLGAAGIREVM